MIYPDRKDEIRFNLRKSLQGTFAFGPNHPLHWVVASHTKAGGEYIKATKDTPGRDTSIPGSGDSAYNFKANICRDLMMQRLSPANVAGINAGQQVLHILGDWNVLYKQFDSVITLVKATITVGNPDKLLAIESFFSNVWYRRDFAATFAQQGIMKVGVEQDASNSLREVFARCKEHRPVVYTSTPVTNILEAKQMAPSCVPAQDGTVSPIAVSLGPLGVCL